MRILLILLISAPCMGSDSILQRERINRVRVMQGKMTQERANEISSRLREQRAYEISRNKRKQKLITVPSRVVPTIRTPRVTSYSRPLIHRPVYVGRRCYGGSVIHSAWGVYYR